MRARAARGRWKGEGERERDGEGLRARAKLASCAKPRKASHTIGRASEDPRAESAEPPCMRIVCAARRTSTRTLVPR